MGNENAYENEFYDFGNVVICRGGARNFLTGGLTLVTRGL